MTSGRTLSVMAAALVLAASAAGAWACAGATPTAVPSPTSARSTPTRLGAISAEAVKQVPEADAYAPILHSAEWSDPVPLPAPINTAGAEDSPFFAPDGRLYFFFTPSLAQPPELQLTDGVTGIYAASAEGVGWGEPARVTLQDPGRLALDGCAFVDASRLWFCTAREGLEGIHWFTAKDVDGRWAEWELADALLPQDGQVGELHFSADGQTLVFHSDRPQGAGGRDVWMATRQAGGSWSPSVNLADVNTEADEGWPYLSPDGQELWFTRTYRGSPCVFRALRRGDRWSEPELIVERFAGEPALDAAGNLYFVHHYLRDGVLIEADIYVALRRG
ncbi:MAG: hypothetical protein FJZ97_12385 [Chloroflexi bacterium]|nr:hypothetical protein [Chloroflexota bacterium]